MQTKQKRLSAKVINKRVHTNPRSVWTELIEESGEEFFFQGNLITANPNRVHELLHNRKHTIKRSKVYKLMGRLLLGSDGILFQDGKKWETKLRQVMPTLTKPNVEYYRKDLYQLAKKHTQEWKEKKTTDDFYLDMTNLGVDMMLKLCLGLNPNDSLSKEYGGSLRDFKLFMMYETVRIDEFGATAGQLLKTPLIVRDLLRMRNRMKIQKKILIKLIVQKKVAQNQLNWINLFQKSGMSISEMTHEINHIYAAFNAIDYLMTCAVYALNAFPECQKPLIEELEKVSFEVFHKSKNPVNDFPELIAFMREVLRFFPATISVMRQIGVPIKVEGKNYPIGTEVVILVHALHFSPKYWEAPNTFNPNRFKTKLKEPKAFIPFLSGPRKCIGQHLAESHFLHTLLAIIHSGIPKVDTNNFEIQPYMIPRLKHRLFAQF